MYMVVDEGAMVVWSFRLRVHDICWSRIKGCGECRRECVIAAMELEVECYTEGGGGGGMRELVMIIY